MNSQVERKCNICDTPVDLSNLHPNSLELPADDSEWSAMHTGCANGEDRLNGVELSDEQLSDERAWIKHL